MVLQNMSEICQKYANSSRSKAEICRPICQEYAAIKSPDISDTNRLGSINARDRGDPSTAVPDEGVYRISNWGEQKPIRIPSTFAQATVSVFVSRL